MTIVEKKQNGTLLLQMKNDVLEVEIAPDIGGKITSIRELESGHQFLWTNDRLPLERLPAGSEYDDNFYGGIDELIPNDIPEDLDGVPMPDHGELWTTKLGYSLENDKIALSGTLPLSRLNYRKEISFCPGDPGITLHYKIENRTDKTKKFLWKFHAALDIQPGDEIICPAKNAIVADPAWSRWTDLNPFRWPDHQGQRADLIPPKEDAVDFLYLYDLKDGYMGWSRPEKNLTFLYSFDQKIFPYCWYFASYGGFYGHYTAVLEPCTTMPASVNEAFKLGQCSVLKPGGTIETTVQIYAGSTEHLSRFL